LTVNAKLIGIHGIRIWRSRRVLRRRALKRFDVSFYDHQSGRLSSSIAEAFEDFLEIGHAQGRDPAPWFSVSKYLNAYPDVRNSGENAFLHFVGVGEMEGRHSFSSVGEIHGADWWFDPEWYLQRYPDVAAAGMDPLVHFLTGGQSEGRWPGWWFDPEWYLQRYPDVAAAGMDPLVHFLTSGRVQGRSPRRTDSAPILPHGRRFPVSSMPSGMGKGRITWALKPDPSPGPARNVTFLLPGFGHGWLSAGPLNALVIAFQLSRWHPVRLVSVDPASPLPDMRQVTTALRDALGADLDVDSEAVRKRITFEVGTSLDVTPGEALVATAWWTVPSAREAAFISGSKRFVYLIQDFEPILHNASSSSVLARETYNWDFFAVVSSQTLLDHFVAEGLGSIPHSAEAGNVHVLPCASVSKSHRVRALSSKAKPVEGKRTLLFYARPSKASRNLYELGLFAISQAIQLRIFDPDEWEFLSLGEDIEDVEMGDGAVLRNIPWLDYGQYLSTVAAADIYISLMESPHTGFPILESAQLGVIGLTTTYGLKDKQFFERLSPLIVAAEPTTADVLEGLRKCVELVEQERLPNRAHSQELLGFVEPLSSASEAAARWISGKLGERTYESQIQLDEWSGNEGCTQCCEARANRVPELKFSIAMSVFDTDPQMFRAALASIARLSVPDDVKLEVLILDNGSHWHGYEELTNSILPSAIFLSSSRNLGIVGGMRKLLESASGEYFVPVDSDDLLAERAIEILTAHISAEPDAVFLYSDEVVFDDDGLLLPLIKGDFDIVLSTEICETAHLCCLSTEVAREIDAYGSRWPDGSHDWYSSSQFLAFGHRLLHVPHILYGWRSHPNSTSTNWRTKSYVIESQQRAQLAYSQVLGAVGGETISHPNFPEGPNQRLVAQSGPDDFGMSLVIYGLSSSKDSGLPLTTISCLEFNRWIAERASEGATHVWFLPDQAHFDTVSVEEAEAIHRIYGRKSILTGPVIIEGVSLWESTRDYSNYRNPSLPGNAFLALRDVCRHEATEVNPFNCLVPLEVLQQFAPDMVEVSVESYLHRLMQAASRVGVRCIASHSLRISVQGVSADRIHLARDLATLTAVLQGGRTNLDGELQVTHEQVTDFRIGILTTLKATSDFGLLQDLAQTVLPQLGPKKTWHVLLHGEGENCPQELEFLRNAENVNLICLTDQLNLTAAYAAVLDSAGEEFVIYVDYDDLLLPWTLEIMASYLRVGVDAVIGDELVGSSLPTSRYFRRTKFNPVSYSDYSLLFHPIMVRRSLLVDNGFPDQKSEYFHDWEVIQILLHRDACVVQLSLPLYFWRQHEGSHTNGGALNLKALDCRRNFLEDRVKRLPFGTARFRVDTPLGLPPEDFTIVRKHRSPSSVCLSIWGGTQEGRLEAAWRWMETFPFAEVVLSPTYVEAAIPREAGLILLVHVDWYPTDGVDVWAALGIVERYGCRLFGFDTAGSVTDYSREITPGLSIDAGGNGFLQRGHYPWAMLHLGAPELRASPPADGAPTLATAALASLWKPR